MILYFCVVAQWYSCGKTITRWSKCRIMNDKRGSLNFKVPHLSSDRYTCNFKIRGIMFSYFSRLSLKNITLMQNLWWPRRNHPRLSTSYQLTVRHRIRLLPSTLRWTLSMCAMLCSTCIQNIISSKVYLKYSLLSHIPDMVYQFRL